MTSADASTLTWDDMSVNASKVESIQVISGIGEGLTLVVTQTDGVSLVAPYAKVSANTLRAFVARVEQNSLSVWVPKFLRRG